MMDDERLKQVLTRRSEQEISATMDLRTSIRKQIAIDGGGHSRRPALKRPLLVAALLLMTTTAAYAFYQSVIQPDPGIQAVQNENRVVQLDQTQMIDAVSEYASDITNIDVTLDYAYADANRITIAFSAVGQPAANEIDLYVNPILTDGSGRQFLWLVNSGQQVRDTANSTVSGIMSFDASAITDAPATLDLSLRLDVAYTTVDLRTDDPNAMLMAGSSEFSFALPFNAGRTIAVDQSVITADLAVQMRQVVIAPSLTRIDVCYDPTRFSTEEWLSWEASVSLAINDTLVIDHQSSGIEGFVEPDAPCRALTIPAALGNQNGTWALTVHDFHNTVTGDVLLGEWSYAFNVE